MRDGPRAVEEFGATGCFGGDDHVPRRGDNLQNSLPHNRMIISDEDPDHDRMRLQC